MKKSYNANWLFLLVFLLAFSVRAGAENSYVSKTHLRTSFDEVAHDIAFTRLVTGGTNATLSDGTAIFDVSEVGFNSAIAEIVFKEEMDLSGSAIFSLTYKTQDWTFSNPTDWGGNFKFVLYDKSGVQTGFEWDNGGSSSHFRWGAWGVEPTPPTEWVTIDFQFEGGQEGFDYTQVEKLVLINRYHDGSWGGGSAKMSGKFILDKLFVGAPDMSKTSTHMSMNFNDGDLTAGIFSAFTGGNGGEVTPLAGTAVAQVNGVGFNAAFWEMEFTSTLDLTGGAPVYIRYKTEDWVFSDPTDWGGYLKFNLEDDEGNKIGLEWNDGGASSHFRWGTSGVMPTPPTDWVSMQLSFEGSSGEFNYDKVKKIVLVNRYHDGSWGGGSAPMTGKLIIDAITVGIPTLGETGAVPNLTWSYFKNPFEGTTLSNEEQTLTLYPSVGVTALQDNGEMVLTLDNSPSYQSLFEMELVHSIDISTGSNLVVTMKANGITVTDGEAGDIEFIWYLVDENGNSTKKDAWQTSVGAASGEFVVYTKNMAGAPENADLTKIKKIVLHNQSRGPAWSENKISGTITIDEVTLGTIKLATSKRGDTWYENLYTEIGKINDSNQMTAAGQGVTLDQAGGVLKITNAAVGANSSILEVTLNNLLDLSLAVEPRFKLAFYPSLASATPVYVAVKDNEGNLSEKLEVILSDEPVTVDFAISAGEANLAKILSIVVLNGGEELSGAISIDSMFVGDLKVKIVIDPITYVVPVNLSANITVDGLADEDAYQAIEPEVMDRVIKWNSNLPDPTDEDISASFKMFTNGEKLFLHVDIVDDSKSVFVPGVGAGHEFDGVEIYFNPDLTNDSPSGAYGSDAVQIGIPRTGKDSINLSGTKGIYSFQYAMKEKDANGWYFEFGIELANLGVDITTDTIGFEIAVIDADADENEGRRTYKRIWNMDRNLDDAWKDTRTFGTVVFAEIPKVDVEADITEVLLYTVKVTFDPAIPGLAKSNFEIFTGANKLTIKDVTTSDEGATYIVESQNSFRADRSYVLKTSVVGFEIEDLPFDYIPVSVNQIDANEVLFYPVPVTSVLNVESASTSIVSLMNANGQVVAKTFVFSNTHVIDMTAFPAGVYVLSLTNNDGAISNYKIVK